MHKIKSQYPILEKCTYLNVANHGLISQQLIDYRLKELSKMRDTASLYTNTRNIFIDKVRTTIATFLDAKEENTAVIPNFSTGFNTLIEGIDKNAKFLLLEDDYPSINWPLETHGFDCVYATINEHMEDNILKACQEHQPDFFCFSVVQYLSGIKIDLEFVKQLKQQFPDMVLIGDLTQYIGSEEFRFRESGLDIILASCYKWLNAGDGNGFICVKDKVKEIIKPNRIGYRSTRNVIDTIPEFIGRFEPGHQDMMAFGSLQHAIMEVNELGWDTIEAKTKIIATAAKEAFEKRNLLDKAVVERQNHSSIFNIKGDQRLYELLLDKNIITSLRGDGLRVSFAYFNTIADLNKLLEVLDLQRN